MKIKGVLRLEYVERYVAVLSGFIVGVISLLTDLFGVAVVAMFGLMIADFISGLLVAIYKGNVNYSLGVKGLIKKCMIVLVVLALWIASNIVEVDVAIASGAATMFAVLELASVANNATKIDIIIPKRIRDFIQSLMGADK